MEIMEYVVPLAWLVQGAVGVSLLVGWARSATDTRGRSP